MKIDNSGQILLEVLIAIAVAGAVAVLGSQLIFISLVGNKIAGNNNVASGLVEGGLEAAKAASTENWQNIYSLTHGTTTKYYLQQSSGKWVITAGTESVPLNNASYGRYFILQNVCRNITTRAITGVSDSGGSTATCNNLTSSAIDPSTQKITFYVAWPNASTISDSDYLTRWRNVICADTNWSGGRNSPTDNVFICSGSVSSYYTDDGTIDTSTVGVIKLKAS
jgi:type II secretory pathway pseudopilin PulG